MCPPTTSPTRLRLQHSHTSTLLPCLAVKSLNSVSIPPLTLSTLPQESCLRKSWVKNTITQHRESKISSRDIRNYKILSPSSVWTSCRKKTNSSSTGREGCRGSSPNLSMWQNSLQDSKAPS